ncbi:MAG: hypothetical protein Q8J75_06210, partial [Rhodocyclaceae bacterium]|nr:hypothetical protein [Rhodocyclaceae bacterium]
FIEVPFIKKPLWPIYCLNSLDAEGRLFDLLPAVWSSWILLACMAALGRLPPSRQRRLLL